MLRVKVCGLNDPLNVKAISESGADFLGFIFYPDSKRFVGRNPDKMMFMDVPEGIKKTGVFVNENPSRILELSEFARLDVIQLHGNESVEYCRSLKMSGLLIIKTFSVGSDFDPAKTDLYSDACDYFLFDTKSVNHGGSGSKFNWKIIENYTFNKPFFLSGGIGPEDSGIVTEIVSKHFYAIDINSRFEILPGIKDAVRVKNFINEIKRSCK